MKKKLQALLACFGPHILLFNFHNLYDVLHCENFEKRLTFKREYFIDNMIDVT